MLPEWVYQECPGISTVHRDAAISRQGELTKPAGALGRLEQLAIELAGLQQPTGLGPSACRSLSLPAITALSPKGCRPIPRKSRSG